MTNEEETRRERDDLRQRVRELTVERDAKQATRDAAMAMLRKTREMEEMYRSQRDAAQKALAEEHERYLGVVRKYGTEAAAVQAREQALRAALRGLSPWRGEDCWCKNDLAKKNGAHSDACAIAEAALAAPTDDTALREMLDRVARRTAGYSGANPWSEVAIAEAVNAVLRGER